MDGSLVESCVQCCDQAARVVQRLRDRLIVLKDAARADSGLNRIAMNHYCLEWVLPCIEQLHQQIDETDAVCMRSMGLRN